jgi:hypothetical protein
MVTLKKTSFFHGTSPMDGTGWYMPCGMYRTLDPSACSTICRQAQARAPVRMHLFKAYVMPYHTATLQNYILKIWQSYIKLVSSKL